MKYEISSILLMLAFLFGIASFSTTTYGGKKPQTNTGSVEIQESKEDRKTDLPKIIQTVWIEKTKEKSISKIANPVKSSSIKNTPKVSIVKKVENYSQSGSKIIYRHWWNDPRVQYAYNISGGDMDFIKTIEAESKWDINALWDSGKSFWLCQIHKGYNPAMQKMYRALKTDNEKVKMCYDQYKDWVKRGVIKTRLYWFNVRNKPQNKNSFTIY